MRFLIKVVSGPAVIFCFLFGMQLAFFGIFKPFAVSIALIPLFTKAGIIVAGNTIDLWEFAGTLVQYAYALIITGLFVCLGVKAVFVILSH